MRRFSAILPTVFVLLPVCCLAENETMSYSTTSLNVTPSTTSAVMFIITISDTTPVSPTTSLPSTAVSPTATSVPPDDEDVPVIEWIRGNPIITGLSGATLILTLLLVCMCYLWCCKKQKVTVYKIVDIGRSECEADSSDGEVVSNPWVGQNGAATTATEQSTDNELELKVTQANSVIVRIVDHDQETELAKEKQERQETVTVDMQEEIPPVGSMTINWPDGLGTLS